MKTGTAIFFGAIILALTSMFEVQVLDTREIKGGVQYHVTRYNRLTGDLSACVVSYANDETWASCTVSYDETKAR